MLAVKRLASVTPEVDLEIHYMQVMKHASKGSTLAFETQNKRHQKSKLLHYGSTNPMLNVVSNETNKDVRMYT